MFKKKTPSFSVIHSIVTFSLFLFKGDRNYYVSSTKTYRSSQTIILFMFSIFPHQAFNLISHKRKKTT